MGPSTYFPGKIAEIGGADYDEGSFLSLPCLSRGLYNPPYLTMTMWKGTVLRQSPVELGRHAQLNQAGRHQV
jgi:hypothetical protein